MAMVVKNNMSAKNTLNQLDKNDKASAKSLKKLASGMKINSAGDDASGLSISERMATQIRSLDQDNSNTQNASSLMKVASGAIDSSVEILTTLKEKVINAANDTNTDADRATIQKELNQAVDQLDDNAQVTFNGKTLLDGQHNSQVLAPGTLTTLVNTELSADTLPSTKMTALQDRQGISLGIQSSDTVTVSYVKQGKTYTGNFVVGTNKFRDVFWDASAGTADIGLKTPCNAEVGYDQYHNMISTPDGTNAVAFQSRTAGLDGQISGLTITVTDDKGQPRTTANASLNNFTEWIRAQDPSDDNALVFQTGTKANQTVKLGLTDMRATALGLRATDGSTLDISTQLHANAAINVVDSALKKALDQQTTLGSVTSRMETTSANITTSGENTQAAESVIRDANMATEMTDYTKNNVLQQAAQSMLAQANQNSSSVLSLLK